MCGISGLFSLTIYEASVEETHAETVSVSKRGSQSKMGLLGAGAQRFGYRAGLRLKEKAIWGEIGGTTWLQIRPWARKEGQNDLFDLFHC